MNERDDNPTCGKDYRGHIIGWTQAWIQFFFARGYIRPGAPNPNL